MISQAIITEKLSKNYGSLKAVDNISFEVKKGDIFAFLGPNGAGKTTTIKLLTGLLKPSSGHCSVAGWDIQKNPQEAKQVIGFVSDQPYIYPHLTGFEFMHFVGNIYKVPVTEQKEKIPEFLEMFELQKSQDDMVETYSHGMKQKLVLASVLLHKPEILFLDEPLVGLDPKSAKLVKDIFYKLSERGVTIFMCTHVLEIAERLAHKAGIIQQGKIIALETVSELKKRAAFSGTLEDIFLELTGGTEYAALLKHL